MHVRGVVDEPTAKVWPSDSFAAEALGVPVNFAHSMWDSRYVCPNLPNYLDFPITECFAKHLEADLRDSCSPKVVCVNKDLIGWKPVWNRERLLQSFDEEIDDFLELGMPKSSHLDSLGHHARR